MSYNGILNKTIDDVTLVATGTVPITIVGVLNKTIDDVTLVSSGVVVSSINGILNQTLDDIGLIANGFVAVSPITGTLNITLEDVTLSSKDTIREIREVYPSMMVLSFYPPRNKLNQNLENLAELILFKPLADEDHIENYFRVDSGMTYNGDLATIIKGLDHLEGEVVSILADGMVIKQQVVKDGQIVLKIPAYRVHAGLPYKSILQTMEPELPDAEGTAKGRLKRINRCVFRVNKTNRFKYGNTPDLPLKEILFNDDPLFSGDVEVSIPTGFDREGFITIVQEDPVPVTIVAIIPEIEVS